MYNVVVVFDLSRISSLRFITNTLSMFIDRLFPVRFGIVPIVETEDSVKMAKVFYFLVQNYGRRATMEFFGSVRTVFSVIAHSHSCHIRFLMCQAPKSRWTGFMCKRNSKHWWRMKTQWGKKRPYPLKVSSAVLPTSLKRGFRKPRCTRNGWVRLLSHRPMVTFSSTGSTMLPMMYVVARMF